MDNKKVHYPLLIHLKCKPEQVVHQGRNHYFHTKYEVMFF